MNWSRLIRVGVTVVLIGLYFYSPATTRAADSSTGTLFLKGQFLVASKKMPDPRFAKTVILMVHHDETGAQGFAINKAFGWGPLAKLLKGFGITSTTTQETVGLYYGGPVELSLAAVLHSPDYKGISTNKISNNLAWSNHKNILSAIAEGKGPAKRVFMLGYCGWSPGQLESEIAREMWLTAPADAELIFDKDPKTLWDRIMAKAGVKL